MKQLPVIPIVNDYPPDIIAKALADRGVPVAVYDFIKHNLGDGAALAAIMVGEYRKPNPPEDDCGCS